MTQVTLSFSGDDGSLATTTDRAFRNRRTFALDDERPQKHVSYGSKGVPGAQGSFNHWLAGDDRRVDRAG